MSPWVRRSAQLSVGIQFFTNVLIVSAFFVDWETVPNDLNAVLILEGASQFIEFLWYAVVLWRNEEIVAWKRYVDWFLSTPLMLTSLALFFCYRADRSIGDDPAAIAVTIAFNQLMLVSGYAAETGRVPLFYGTFAGLCCLLNSFVALSAFVRDSLSTLLHALTLAVWSLYGAAALLEPVPKNVSYNVLDLFSKNCFGVFLTIYTLVTYS